MSQGAEAMILADMITKAGDTNNDGHRKVGLLLSTQASAKNLGLDLKARLEAAGIATEALYLNDQATAADVQAYPWNTLWQRITDNQTETADPNNLSGPTIATVTDYVPDAVALINFNGVVNAVQQAVSVNTTMPMFSGHALLNYRTRLSLAGAVNGIHAVATPLVDDAASGDVFGTELTALNGLQVQFADANAYDAMIANMLAALKAGLSMTDASQVTGAQIRDNLRAINDKSSGTTLIRTGPTELSKAIDLLASGKPIDYEGASGPVDFDANGNVNERWYHWLGKSDGKLDIVAKYDCVSDPVNCPVEP
jgi:hypothetical protein